MPRPRFTLRTLLVAVLVVGAFFGGMAMQRQLDKPLHHRVLGAGLEEDAITLPDGSVWIRYPFDEVER